MPKNPGDYHTVYEGGLADIIVRAGYAVRAIDHQSCGRSESRGNRRCNFEVEHLVDESEQYIVDHVMNEVELKGKPIFLFGISLGGAVALRVSENNPDRYNGMCLFSPMCSLEKVREQRAFLCIKNRQAEPLMGLLACICPTLPIVSTSQNVMFPDMQEEFDNDILVRVKKKNAVSRYIKVIIFLVSLFFLHGLLLSVTFVSINTLILTPF